MAIRKRTWQSGGEAKTAWVVDYSDQHGTRRLKTFRTKRAATDWATAAGYEVKQGVHTAASVSITVKKAGELWIANGKADGLERATTRQYQQHIDLHIVPWGGDKKLSDLTAPMIKDFETWLRDNGRSPAMVRKVVGSLGALLADAQEAGRVARNVVRERRRPRRHKAQAKRQKRRLEIGRDIPSPAEVKALLVAASGKERPIIVTAAFTGMRASELRGLTWDSVDLDGKVIHVRQRADRWNAPGAPKSEAGQRSIPMTPLVANTLREWKLACPRHGVIRDQEGKVVDPGKLLYVFPNGAGNIENHGNLYARIFVPAWLAAGAVETGKLGSEGQPVLKAKYGIHALRHFYASWLLGEKARGGLEVSPKRAQTLLGHSGIQMTMDTYGHLQPPKGDEADEFAEGEAALLA